MGEKTVFSESSDLLSEKKKKRETALSGLSFLPVSSGYFLYTFSLLTFVFTVLVAAVLYFTITMSVAGYEKLFMRYGSDFLLASEEGATMAAKTSRYSSLTRFVKNHYESQAPDARFIQEIFFLDRKGKVLVHTDLTKLTQSSNTSINRLSTIYNNELFHTGLMLPESTVNIQPYPYDNFSRDRSGIYFLRHILPDSYFDAMDFSMPVFVNQKPAGTMHIVLTRTLSDALLRQYLEAGLYAWGTLIFVSLILSFFIKLPVMFRLKKLKTFVEKYLVEDIEMYLQKTEKHKIQEEIEYIDAKISEMVQKAGDFSSAQKPAREIKNAYLIREN